MTTLTKLQISGNQIKLLAKLGAVDIDQVRAITQNHGKLVFGILRKAHRMTSTKGHDYLLLELQGCSLGFHQRFSCFIDASLTCIDPDIKGHTMKMQMIDGLEEGALWVGRMELNGVHVNLKDVSYIGMVD